MSFGNIFNYGLFFTFKKNNSVWNDVSFYHHQCLQLSSRKPFYYQNFIILSFSNLTFQQINHNVIRNQIHNLNLLIYDLSNGSPFYNLFLQQVSNRNNLSLIKLSNLHNSLLNSRTHQ